ncbi:hypothetical protein KY360_03875 [Candidatus Woesearchaeota archaeon]|nr:hypothetical protein [Candidatus Woesearchaeota archaeon]
MEVSNKLVATLLLLTIVISLAGTLVSLNKVGKLGFTITGMAVNTSRGVARLYVGALTELTNQVPTIDWGTGYVNSTFGSNCTMDSEGNLTGCVAFSPVYEGFLLENTGNKRLSVNFTSDKNASTFINGTDPLFQLKATPNFIAQQDNESIPAVDNEPSCNYGWYPNGTYLDVTTGGWYLCGNETEYPLHFGAGKDAVVIDLKVRVPEDATTGAKNATLTFLGTSP